MHDLNIKRHLRPLVFEMEIAFFGDGEYGRDEINTGGGDGSGATLSCGEKNGADVPDWVGSADIRMFEHEYEGGFLFVCRPTGYMEDRV